MSRLLVEAAPHRTSRLARSEHHTCGLLQSVLNTPRPFRLRLEGVRCSSPLEQGSPRCQPCAVCRAERATLALKVAQ